MKTDKLLIGAVALAGGILVGKNWDNIKKFVVGNVTKIGSIKTEVASISCPQCQTELKSTALFCYKCGRKQ